MVGGDGGPKKGNHERLFCCDPVNLSTGLFVYTKTDLFLPDVIPLSLTRTYRPSDSFSRPFGIGTTHPYELFIGGDGHSFGTTPYIDLFLEDGTRIHFRQTKSDPQVYMHTSSQSSWYGATIRSGGSPPPGVTLLGQWQLTTRDGTIYSFPLSDGLVSPSCQALVGITDKNGNQIKFNRDPGDPNTTNRFCDLLSITSTNGRFINFQYDNAHRITSATDNGGRTVQYAYDGSGRLISVTDANGGVTNYVYDDVAQMIQITDARQISFLTNHYDNNGAVDLQTQADGSTFSFHWTPSLVDQQPILYTGPTGCNGCEADVDRFRQCSFCYESYTPVMLKVDVDDPNGNTRHVEFDPKTGHRTLEIINQYTSEEQQFSYQYYPDDLLKNVIDPLGHVTSFDTYDGLGNPDSITKMAGTSAAATTKMSYGSLSNLGSITDALGHTTQFVYDWQNNLRMIVDPLHHQTTMSYDKEGRLLAVTDPMQNTGLLLSYDGPDLSSVTDAQGNTKTQFYDSIGRLVSTLNPLGERVQYVYNNLNQVTQVTDPLGGVTSFSYDPNGNLLTVQDARQQGTNLQTSYVYDLMDRVQKRTDPLGRQQSYSYDPNGNLASFTDRNGKVTTFRYDHRNHKTFAGFGTTGNPPTYESTINYTYDIMGRLTQITDSASGNITHSYDDLNRTSTETVGTRSVTVVADALGRPTSLQVTGQPEVSYQYDPQSNRLLHILKGAASVGFGYDDDDRRTSMTLPNGMAVSYVYDAGNHLNGITYQLGTTVLGSLIYNYDAAGRRTQVSGSLARTGLPPALTAATYDDANQIASWNGTPFSYDNDGNLTNDGSKTYTWNARGQLAGMAGPVNAAFSYDATGRRTGKLLGSQNTGFTYNGGAIAQELNGSTVTAELWNGGTSYFQRTDANGATVPVTDALGSVLALADPSGNFVTQYTYDPYGATSSFGAPSTNAFQYIGQENDGLTGLYFLHARYYSPALMRFISEDPLGYAGGDMNFHAYGWKSPTNLRDPNGTEPVEACIIGGLVYANVEAWKNVFNGRKNSLESVGHNLVNGCVQGVVLELLGINWLLGKAIGVVFTLGVDIISDVAARALTDELEAAAEDAAEATCGGCLPAGTPIHTKHGLVPIEKIKKGDEILSRNHASGKLEYQRVTGVVTPHLDRLMQISFASEANALNPTPTHPFFVKHAGEKASGWAEASVVKVGDEVLTAKGTWSLVTAVSTTETEATVYNFEVKQDHDFFVGSSGLLVHNSFCAFGTEVHQKFLEVLMEQTGTTAEDWQMATAPGETGVDATYVGDASTNPGFNYAELKPVNYPDAALANQVSSWGLPQGETSVWWYNSNGIIGQTLGSW